MNNPLFRFSTRFLTLFLSFSLSLPNLAFALRQTGLEEQTDNEGKPVGPKAELVSALIATPSTRANPLLGSTSTAILTAGMEEKFRTPEAASRHLLMNPANEPFVDRMNGLAAAGRLVDPGGRRIRSGAKMNPFLTAAERMDHLGEAPTAPDSATVAYGQRRSIIIAQLAHERYFSKLGRGGDAAELYPLVRVLAEAAGEGTLPLGQRGRPSPVPQRRIERFISLLPGIAHGYLKPWVDEWNSTGQVSLFSSLHPLGSSPVVPPRALTGQLFSMDGEEARRVLAWSIGTLPLEQGKDYLAFGQTRTMLNIPTTLLADVLPNKEPLRAEVGAPGLKQAGGSVAVTQLLRAPAERGTPVPYTKEQMPWLLYRYHEDPDSKEKWISVYRLPSGIRPRLADRQRLFEQISADPKAHVGEILIDFPADLDAEPASNKHLSVFTSLEKSIRGFLRKSISLAERGSWVEYPNRLILPLADGGLDAFWSELERAGVSVADGVKPQMARSQEEGWTHFVLQRVFQADPYGNRHFLIRIHLARRPLAVLEPREESPLQAVILLASNHPQWRGGRYVYLPHRLAWAVGLIHAADIMPADREINVRTLKVTLAFLWSRVQKRPTQPPTIARGPYETGIQRVVDIPGISPGDQGKLPAFDFPRTKDTTRWIERVGELQESQRWPLEFKEDAVSGTKWVGVRRPGTASPYRPENWFSLSARNRVGMHVSGSPGMDLEPGIQFDRETRRSQLRRGLVGAERYLQGKTAASNPWLRVRIAPSTYPNLAKKGSLDVRLFSPAGVHGWPVGFPTIGGG